jgi:hypothetical protein
MGSGLGIEARDQYKGSDPRPPAKVGQGRGDKAKLIFIPNDYAL